MNLKVLAEAGPKVGLGHLVRSMALAGMVKDLVDVSFYLVDLTLVNKLPETSLFEFRKLSTSQDFLEQLEKNDVVLLDGYNYSLEFQQQLREKCFRLIVIDDKHDRELSADYIINHAPAISEDNYRVEQVHSFLLGPDYALLRSPFINVQKSREWSGPGKLLICFGGADPENLSCKMADLALSFEEIQEVVLILGGAYAFRDSLTPLEGDKRLVIRQNLSGTEMAALMNSSDLAIVPSSGILYECLSLGLVCLSGYYADNQSLMYEGWLKLNAIVGVDNFKEDKVRKALMKVLQPDFEPSRSLTTNIIDGHSPQRFQEVFRSILAEYEV